MNLFPQDKPAAVLSCPEVSFAVVLFSLSIPSSTMSWPWGGGGFLIFHLHLLLSGLFDILLAELPVYTICLAFI